MMEFNASLVVGVVGIVANAVMGIVLYRLNKTVNAFNRQEDRGAAEMAAIEAKADLKIEALAKGLHQANEKLIDERFRAISHEVNNASHVFVQALDEMKRKVDAADGEVDGLDDRHHQLELKMLAKLEQMKDAFTREMHQSLIVHESNVATRFDRVANTLGELSQKVAVLSDRVGPRS